MWTLIALVKGQAHFRLLIKMWYNYYCGRKIMKIKSVKITKALNRLKAKLAENFGVGTELFLFGSAARGEYREFSDVDVLVLVSQEVNISLEEQIFDLAFEVGLEYDIVFGVIVYSKGYWKRPPASVMPLYENIKQEGIRI